MKAPSPFHACSQIYHNTQSLKQVWGPHLNHVWSISDWRSQLCKWEQQRTILLEKTLCGPTSRQSRLYCYLLLSRYVARTLLIQLQNSPKTSKNLKSWCRHVWCAIYFKISTHGAHDMYINATHTSGSVWENSHIQCNMPLQYLQLPPIPSVWKQSEHEWALLTTSKVMKPMISKLSFNTGI